MFCEPFSFHTTMGVVSSYCLLRQASLRAERVLLLFLALASVTMCRAPLIITTSIREYYKTHFVHLLIEIP